MKAKGLIFLALVTSSLVIAPQSAHGVDTKLIVFAAASLTDSLTEVAANYETESHFHPTLVFAASSSLARQIENGAQADLFLSADARWMDYLADRGLIQADTRKDLLSNQIVLIAPQDSTISITIKPGFDLAGALKGGKLSIADPDSVPAGRYARQALKSLGIWNSVMGKLASAENVRVALTYVARGEAPLGVVYATDAKMEPRVKVVGVFPEDSHLPILYPVALTKASGAPDAKAFLAAIESPESAAVFAKYGFTLLK